MTAPSRSFRHVCAAIALSALAACGGSPSPANQPRPLRVLVSSLRAEPRTFNRYAGRDSVLETLTHLLHAKLVRIDRRTQEVEPWLAKSWTASADGLTYTLKLRDGVTFSDGAPFTSADVLFAFRAVYDGKDVSGIGDSLRVGGKTLQASAPDPSTVVIRFPSPFGPGIRLLDNLPILPRHKLEAALTSGTLPSAWGLSTPASDIVGLGPFVLKEYQPGQRLVLDRNTRYWRTDDQGSRLPLLDRITLEIVPDQNAELLRLQSGQIDFTQTEIRPEDYAALQPAAKAGKIRLADLGVGLEADSLWLNLRPGRSARRTWLQRVELRRAISHAVDRRAFADTVFLGAAVPVFGPITPGNARWYAPDIPKYDYDPAEARRLLASLGLSDRNGDAVLEDRAGARAEITLITQKGNTAVERGAGFIRDELAKVGLVLNVVPLDVGSLIDRVERGDYEAVFYRFLITALDPALNMDLWLSSGGFHLWNPSQRVPATEWERRIDELMHTQAQTLDEGRRKALFDEVQRIFAEQQPMIQFAAQRIVVATSARVENATPALVRPAVVLWNPDRLSVKDGASR